MSVRVPERATPEVTTKKHEAHRILRVLAVVVVSAAVGAGSGTAAALLASRDTPSASSSRPVAVGDSEDVPALLTRVLPAVVSIRTTQASGGQAAGTGMIVSPDGEVLTNAHVVEGATSISVDRYGTSRELGARLLGASVRDDLALIKVDDVSDLPTVELGSSSEFPVGSRVLAVGNALGLSAGTPTVTEGIVSAQGRSITTEHVGRDVTMEGLLQTDAAINPGNSGGPLFDLSGDVIGVNTAIAGSAEGIGFAIPVDHVKEMLGSLRRGGPSGAPGSFLGVIGVGIDAAIRAAHGLPQVNGVLITSVVPSSPAANARLEPGDVILEVEGTPTDDTVGLAAAIHRYRPGQVVQLLILHSGVTTTQQVTLADAPLTAS
jgi:S1-C subfamily serine protease